MFLLPFSVAVVIVLFVIKPEREMNKLFNFCISPKVHPRINAHDRTDGGFRTDYVEETLQLDGGTVNDGNQRFEKLVQARPRIRSGNSDEAAKVSTCNSDGQQNDYGKIENDKDSSSILREDCTNADHNSNTRDRKIQTNDDDDDCDPRRKKSELRVTGVEPGQTPPSRRRTDSSSSSQDRNIVNRRREAGEEPIEQREISSEDLNDKPDIKDTVLKLRAHATRGRTAQGASGLLNLGNTCFMNTIIQCLSNSKPLAKYFLNRNYIGHINKTNRNGTQGKVASAFSALIYELHRGTNRVVKPDAFLNTVCTVSKQIKRFGNGRQHDAQEFLAVLLDALHEDLDQVQTKHEMPPRRNEGKRLLTAGREAWVNFERVSRSYVRDLFKGQMISTLTCCFCGNSSATFEVITQVNLELPQRRIACSLNDCLKEHVKAEQVQWNCSQCHEERIATKKVDFWKLPHLMIIHLKRFEEKEDGGHRKMNTRVDFPLSDLSMKDFIHTHSDHTPKKYQLYAVTNHYGDLHRGHYAGLCLVESVRQWHEFDDDQVTRIDTFHTQSSQNAAYILFYEELTDQRK